MNIYNYVMYSLLSLTFFEILADKTYVLCLKTKDFNQKFAVKKIIAVLIGIVLIIIAANRSQQVGRDLINYLPRYNNISRVNNFSELKQLANSYSFELGFTLLCKLFSFLGNDGYIFIRITSIIVGIGFIIITNKSKMPIYAWFLIFCFGIWGSSLNVIRQYMALTVLAYSIKFIEKNNNVCFFIMILIATFIHSTSIIFLLIYFFRKKYSDKNFLKSFCQLCIITYLFGVRIVEIVISHTSFAWYLNRHDGSGSSTLIFLFLILFSTYFYKETIKSIDKNSDLWFGSLLITILLNILALRWGIFARAMKFFMPFIMLLIIDFVLVFKSNKLLYLLVNSLVIIFFILYFKKVTLGVSAISEGWLFYS